jgi:glycosyltransferase involved in cell wall biosynthesis
MTIFILRGAHVNQFELQNYEPIAKDLDIRVISSQHTLTPVNLAIQYLWSPADLPRFPYRRQILNRLIGGEQWLAGLENYIRKYRTDHSDLKLVIHTAETYTPYTHQAVKLRKKGLIDKLICTCWETIPHNNEKFALFLKWKHEAYTYVDTFHTPTERAKRALVAEGVDPNKIRVIPYGVDLERFHPAQSRRKHTRPSVLTVARLEKEKGMKVVEEVASLMPNCDFKIIGNGSYIPRAENIAVLSVPYSHIHKEYQRSDIFFLPSQSTSTWEEQYGMALIEAMACGLPIVASDNGAISEVVGNAGSIVTGNDPAEYVRKLKLVKPGVSERSVKRALAHFDRVKVAENLAKLYV